MEEVLARVDVDAADDPLGQVAEVGGEMEEQVGAGGKQEQPAQGAFDRDQAKDDACARRVAGPHRESLSTSAGRSYVLEQARRSDRKRALRDGPGFVPPPSAGILDRLERESPESLSPLYTEEVGAPEPRVFC